MDLKKKQNIMYVHGFEEKTEFNLPGYMNLKKKILCVAQAVGVAWHKKTQKIWPIFFNM